MIPPADPCVKEAGQRLFKKSTRALCDFIRGFLVALRQQHNMSIDILCPAI